MLSTVDALITRSCGRTTLEKFSNGNAAVSFCKVPGSRKKYNNDFADFVKFLKYYSGVSFVNLTGQGLKHYSVPLFFGLKWSEKVQNTI